MSRSAGAGHPITFRCAKCKRGNWRDGNRGTDWDVTGRLKGGPLPERTHTRVSRVHKAEYRCRKCGHVGWSGHRFVLDELRRSCVTSQGVDS